MELYDYVKDPLETKNVASNQPEVVARMRALLAGLPEAKPQIKAPGRAANQTQERTALFGKKDKNHDGQLTLGEFLTDQPDSIEAPKRFMRFDANQDGKLTRDEFISMGAPSKP